MKTAHFLTYRGVTIRQQFHDRHSDVLREFLYTVKSGKHRTQEFDIRDLPSYSGPRGVISLTDTPKPKKEYDVKKFFKHFIDLCGTVPRQGLHIDFQLFFPTEERVTYDHLTTAQVKLIRQRASEIYAAGDGLEVTISEDVAKRMFRKASVQECLQQFPDDCSKHLPFDPTTGKPWK